MRTPWRTVTGKLDVSAVKVREGEIKSAGHVPLSAISRYGKLRTESEGPHLLFFSLSTLLVPVIFDSASVDSTYAVLAESGPPSNPHHTRSSISTSQATRELDNSTLWVTNSCSILIPQQSYSLLPIPQACVTAAYAVIAIKGWLLDLMSLLRLTLLPPKHLVSQT